MALSRVKFPVFWSRENRVSFPPMETVHEIDIEKLWSELYEANMVISTFSHYFIPRSNCA